MFDKRAYNRKYYQDNREREKARAKQYVADNPEKVKAQRRKSYLKNGKEKRLRNIESVRASGRKYMRKRRARLKAEGKTDYVWDEKRKLYQQEYRLKNKEKIAEKRKISLRVRLKTDTNFRLKWLLKSRVIIAIKAQLGDKAYKTIELLGCSIDEAREHLEKQFKSDMDWDNHGKVWEIDHIKPLDAFNLTEPEEQKKAFHYTNLQPLYWLENRQKSNKW